MLSPKEKAKELVDKYSVYTSGWNYDELAKQCALIAVDEILWEIIKYADNSKEYVTENAKFWQEVKTEIQKL
jgi:hypothetical protein